MCRASARPDDIDAGEFPDAISDDIFRRIVAVIRITVPYTGMIISTRESQESREKVLDIGISQISGGVAHQRGRLCRGGDEGGEYLAVRRQRPPHTRRDSGLAARQGIRSELLHRLLSRRAHGRSGSWRWSKAER